MALRENQKARLKQLAVDTSEKFSRLVQEGEEEKQEEKQARRVLPNLGTQFLTNDYESVPVAPSMINKRKPAQNFDFSEKRRGQSPEVELGAEEKKAEKRQQQSFSVDSSRGKGKLKLKLAIDTEQINELYTYGGEKGKKVRM